MTYLFKSSSKPPFCSIDSSSIKYQPSQVLAQSPETFYVQAQIYRISFSFATSAKSMQVTNVNDQRIKIKATARMW